MARIETKVAAATITGAAVTVLVYVCSLFGLDVSEAVAAAAVTLLAGLAGYLAPHTPRPDGS
ncbi:hypothetical protein [Marinitenerispora sediminis]|uniref:Holin n=1 Tax=Marinitenerispora sediminis TaxID=1931232 RepID=A0A368T6C7_9ACTN|nr:hypothetical protein [Marinitenerispora sediminis]RCV53461.1 hypothetical protein DEF23_17430 [Marinitenerispora sediminis]RCV59289.1 hypothetical protein DEF24_09970 [Marinitenerispora sediminis]